MFKSARMARATVWLSSTYAEGALRALGRNKIAHLVESDALFRDDDSPKTLYRCANLLERIEAVKCLLLICSPQSLGPKKPGETEPEETPLKQQSFSDRLDYVEKSVGVIEEDIGVGIEDITPLLMKDLFLFTNKEIASEAEKQNLKPRWINSSDHVYELIGLLENQSIKKLQDSLGEITGGEYIIIRGRKISGYGDKALLAIITLKEYQKKIRENLGVIECRKPTNKIASTESVARLEEIVRKEQAFAVQMKKTFGTLAPLEEKELRCYFMAYVPEKKMPFFRKIISEATHNTAVIKTRRPHEDEDVPILLDNIFFLKPFEAIVKMFSHPQYNEIDPTPMVAITSLIFFGVMFGDVGHGILLMLGGLLYALFKEKKEKKMGPLIMMCAFGSIIAGVMFGLFFGFEDIIKPVLGKPAINVKTMLLVMSLGLIHMSAGLVLAVINRFSVKEEKIEKTSSIINLLSQLMMFIGILAAMIGYYLNYPTEYIIPFMVMSFLLPPILIPLSCAFPAIMKGEAKKILDELLLGVSEFFHIFISAMSNTISYLRILILSFIHEISSAMLVGGTLALAGMSTPGVAAATLLFIFGTIIIMVEGGIVFIQCMRLQYYEFFSKFYTGGGTKYEPYELN